MRCNVIVFLTCTVALIAASSPVTGRCVQPESKTEPEYPNRIDRVVDEQNLKSAGPHKPPSEVVHRRIRSVWKMLANHVANAVETFYAKPLLVDANNFGGFENRISDVSKTAHIMLKKVKNLSEKNLITDKKELEKIREDVGMVELMHDEACEEEDKLLEYLLDNKSDKLWVNDSQVIDMYLDGIKNKTSENIIKILMQSPDLKAKVMKELPYITKLREELREAENEITQNIIPRLDEVELLDYLYTKLQFIKFDNDNWLAYEHAPDFFGSVEKPVQRKSKRKKKRKSFE